MEFHSILWLPEHAKAWKDEVEAPDSFPDLNLDRVVSDITSNHKYKEYELEKFYYRLLAGKEAVVYRQQIFQDLQDQTKLELIRDFAHAMKRTESRIRSASRYPYEYQKEREILDSAKIYCDAVAALSAAIVRADFRSAGFLAFADFLTGYANSDEFKVLATETESLETVLLNVYYSLIIKSDGVVVRRFASAQDYTQELVRIFEKFKNDKSGTAKDRTRSHYDANHVEEILVELIAKFYPAVFRKLEAYFIKNSDYMNNTIRRFYREIQFYLSYIDYIAPMENANLKFCIPAISEVDRNICVRDGFNIALASVLVSNREKVICNDFLLEGDERIVIVTGRNQGGKTTFASSLAQIEYLGCLGLPVPGSYARLCLVDEIFTHFQKEEIGENLKSGLEDDLLRIHDVIMRSTAKSMIIINEMLNSCTLRDASAIGKKILGTMQKIGCVCVYVTFIHDLLEFDKTVCMTNEVNPHNVDIPTYKIVRKQPDTDPYAIHMAGKYGLTYDQLRQRLM